ncbi:MAG: ATP-binding cassette domain-containing protein [Deltaproteobacteria bacterium]|jgi:ABC-type oligopeptide transport system ATPase subunit|nr:ATP-binding cassette domain-containing protein [Deltaproteobacteria bacterium]
MNEPILECKDLSVSFVKEGRVIKAVDGVSLFVERGECFGLVGGSGCGKSTLARLVTRLKDPDSGSIQVERQEATKLKGKALREYYRKVQMVFQDPVGSFDPRMKIGQSIAEVLRNFGLAEKGRLKRAVNESLEMVGLNPEHADRLPTQISGGQCQRAALAKAVAVRPKLLILDEVTSALDVSVQAQIVSLLRQLQAELNMAFIFISHDLSLVRCFATRLAVMHDGQVVETGPVERVISSPQHPHTKLLLSSLFPIPKEADSFAPVPWPEAPSL